MASVRLFSIFESKTYYEYNREVPIDKVKKRNGSIVDFDRERIQNAVHKAYIATRGTEAIVVVEGIVDEVVRDLEVSYIDIVPAVEKVIYFVPDRATREANACATRSATKNAGSEVER